MARNNLTPNTPRDSSRTAAARRATVERRQARKLKHSPQADYVPFTPVRRDA